MTVKELIRLLSKCDQGAQVEITFCYNRSRTPGDCVSLVGKNAPLIIRNPMEGSIELFASNNPGTTREIASRN